MKYIDAEKIRAEIERLKSTNPSEYNYQNAEGYIWALDDLLSFLDTLSEEPVGEEQQEVELEKFTEKMDAWKARYNYPDNFSIKATMAFTARMFYMYPNVAREWYDSLPKVTLD